MTIQLTTIGSRGAEVEVTTAALPEAGPGGVTLWFRYLPGTPLENTSSYTMTVREAKQLLAEVGALVAD